MRRNKLLKGSATFHGNKGNYPLWQLSVKQVTHDGSELKRSTWVETRAAMAGDRAYLKSSGARCGDSNTIVVYDYKQCERRCLYESESCNFFSLKDLNDDGTVGSLPQPGTDFWRKASQDSRCGAKDLAEAGPYQRTPKFSSAPPRNLDDTFGLVSNFDECKSWCDSIAWCNFFSLKLNADGSMGPNGFFANQDFCYICNVDEKRTEVPTFEPTSANQGYETFTLSSGEGETFASKGSLCHVCAVDEEKHASSLNELDAYVTFQVDQTMRENINEANALAAQMYSAADPAATTPCTRPGNCGSSESNADGTLMPIRSFGVKLSLPFHSIIKLTGADLVSDTVTFADEKIRHTSLMPIVPGFVDAKFDFEVRPPPAAPPSSPTPPTPLTPPPPPARLQG